jgi:hypothetical protein
MRWFLLLFIVLNAALGAYIWLRDRGAGAGADAQLMQLQMNADQVKLVPGGSAPADAASKSVPMPPESAPAGQKPAAAEASGGGAQACVEWGSFAGVEATRAEAALAKLGLDGRVESRDGNGAATTWVYLPAAKTRAETERQIAELKTRGVGEYFVVQDGQWRGAISLGIFRSEEAAKVFLATVRGKGVREAALAPRPNLVRQSAFLIREPDAEAVARLAALKQAFPGTDLRAVPCSGPNER